MGRKTLIFCLKIRGGGFSLRKYFFCKVHFFLLLCINSNLPYPFFVYNVQCNVFLYMHQSLTVRLSIQLSVYLSAQPYVSLSFHLPICLSVVYMYFCQYVFPSIYLSICSLYVLLSVRLSIYLSVYL